MRVSRGFFTLQQTCGECRGTGRVIKSPCAQCGGGGTTEAPRKIETAVPGGVDDGEMIRLQHQGGEVLLRMRVQTHPLFRRDGDNLFMITPVSITTAALGGVVHAPKLGGGKIKITIPPETQSGGMLRLRGEGVSRLRGGGRGDMYCRIIVETPVNLGEEQKKLLRDFENSLQKGHTPKGESWLEKVKSIFAAVIIIITSRQSAKINQVVIPKIAKCQSYKLCYLRRQIAAVKIIIITNPQIIKIILRNVNPQVYHHIPK